jgi:hypothetical protein
MTEIDTKARYSREKATIDRRNPSIPSMADLFVLGTMPTKLVTLKDQVLVKLTSKMLWKPTRVALTEEAINMSKPNDDSLRDIIPLLDISWVKKTDMLPEYETLRNFDARSDSNQYPSGSLRIPSWGSAPLNRYQQSGLIASLSQEGVMSNLHIVQVQTIEGGLNCGKTYHLRCQSEEQCDAWVDAIQSAHSRAIRIASPSTLVLHQRRLRAAYHHPSFQSAVAVLISACFLANVIQTELELNGAIPPGGAVDSALVTFEAFFTVCFVLELALNIVAHSLWPFLRDPWNLLDFVAVAVSVAALADYDGLYNLAHLRLARTLRFASFLQPPFLV